MRFLHPGLAWWFLAGVTAVAALRLVARRRLGVATTSPWVFDRAYRASPLRRLPSLVFLAALVLLSAALMDPVVPLAETMRRHGWLTTAITEDGYVDPTVFQIGDHLDQDFQFVRGTHYKALLSLVAATLHWTCNRTAAARSLGSDSEAGNAPAQRRCQVVLGSPILADNSRWLHSSS